jgi:hypothetical protein
MKRFKPAPRFDYKPYLSLIRQRWLQGVTSRRIAEEIGPGANMSTVRNLAQRMNLPMRDTNSKPCDPFEDAKLDIPQPIPVEVDVSGLVPINGRGHYADAHSARIILRLLGRDHGATK